MYFWLKFHFYASLLACEKLYSTFLRNRLKYQYRIILFYRLNEISEQKDAEIKLEESEAIDGVKKMDESVDVKWAIENVILNIKEEEIIEDCRY